MSKYLIIGSKGTVGSEFVRQLEGQDVLATDRTILDITDQDSVINFFKINQPQIVINCAAYTNVDGAETDHASAHKINAEVLKTLSLECNKIQAKLIHFSTGMVFDGTNPNGYDEDAVPNPVNEYGKSKLEGEKIVQELCKNYYIIRTCWIYGTPETESAKKSFVELMIELGKSGKVKGVTDEIGRPTWCKDLVLSTLQLIESNKPSGIYHLTNEGQASRFEWVQEIYNQLNMQVEIEPVSGNDFPRPAKRITYEVLNNNKLPLLRSWQEALSEYLKK
jgi:dTDP-4-dehydrorhamnose reductase